MGSGEENTPAKPTKPAVATQELPTTPSYPDWASPMQAYYGASASTPPPFFPSTVASSPPPHPYLWGGQHLMPPYGTPLPYPAMYPHGGIYGHPPMSAGTIVTASETDGKSSDVKDKGSVKKSKGSSGNTGLASGKSGDGVKAASGSANDGASQSGDSGSEGSSDASDENNAHQEFSAARKKSFDQMIADGANAQHNNAAHYSNSTLESSFSARGQPAAKLPITVPGKPAIAVPTTNLNIGMDLWNNSATVGPAAPIKVRPTAANASAAVVAAAMVGREGVMPDHQWMQDEREMKREKRKQSNRESARRSRLRKQAECEELAGKVETLNNENQSLRNELQRLSQECKKLTSENASIMEQLTRLYGHDAMPSVEVNDANTPGFQSADEDNGHVHDGSRGSNKVSPSNGKFFSSNGKHESGSN